MLINHCCLLLRADDRSLTGRAYNNHCPHHMPIWLSIDIKTGIRKVTLGLLERLFDKGNQISPVPDPELTRSMLNFFKKYTLNLESYDVDTLPGELKEFFKHPMIYSILNPFREDIVQGIKEKVLPVLKQFELMGTVRRPIQVYFPVKDTFVFKVEESVFNGINQP